MGSCEKYRLKFNDWTHHLADSYRDFRSDDDFFDLTLVSADNEDFLAHQLILSVSSTWFKNVLRKHQVRKSQQDLVLYLRGVRSSQLEAILAFIYDGEVSMPREELQEFLDLGSELGIKGLDSPDSPLKPSAPPEVTPEESGTPSTSAPYPVVVKESHSDLDDCIEIDDGHQVVMEDAYSLAEYDQPDDMEAYNPMDSFTSPESQYPRVKRSSGQPYEMLEGPRKNSVLYIAENHTYQRKTRVAADTWYLKCVLANEGCTASARIDTNRGLLFLIKRHNCQRQWQG